MYLYVPFLQNNAATKGGGEGGELCPLTKQIKEGRFSEHNLFQIIGKKQNNITIKIKKFGDSSWRLFLVDTLISKPLDFY